MDDPDMDMPIILEGSLLPVIDIRIENSER